MAKTSARPLKELDLKTRNELDRILAIDPGAMNRHEQGFMAARADYLNKEQKADYVKDVTPIVDEEPEPEEDSYMTWTVPALKAELKARELAVGGNKIALAQRLEAHDEAVPESGE